MKAVNLIPAEQRAGGGSVTGDSEGGAFLVLALLAGIVVLALLYGIAAHQTSSRKDEVASVQAQAQATQARASELTPYVSFNSMYQARLQAVSQLAGTRFDWAHAFHEIGRVLPKDASLSSIHGLIASTSGSASPAPTPAPTPAAPAAGAAGASSAAASATVTSATPPGAVPALTLSGCATSQSEVAETLQRLRLIDGVSSVTLQSSTKATTVGGGASTGGGSCPNGDPQFTMQVSFAPLPTPAGTSSSGTSSTASSSSPGGSAPASTSGAAAPATAGSGGAQ